MATKRYVDIHIWKKKWFRELSVKKKCLWYYIVSQCDEAGFWEIDFELASFAIGETITITDLDFPHTAFVGDKLFLTKFICFQQNKPVNAKLGLWRKIIKLLEDNGLNPYGLGPTHGLWDSLCDSLCDSLWDKQWDSQQVILHTNNNIDSNKNINKKEKKENLIKEKKERSSIQILTSQETIINLQSKFPEVDVPGEIEKMLDWQKSTGTRKKDWVAFARNWLRKTQTDEKRTTSTNRQREAGFHKDTHARLEERLKSRTSGKVLDISKRELE